MEKLKQPPFAGLKSIEHLREIYRQTYLELQSNQIVELSHFQNFEMDWRQAEEEETFEVFHSLNNDKVLRYTCQLETPEVAKSLFEQIGKAEFSADITRQLFEQPVRILSVDTLEDGDDR